MAQTVTCCPPSSLQACPTCCWGGRTEQGLLPPLLPAGVPHLLLGGRTEQGLLTRVHKVPVNRLQELSRQVSSLHGPWHTPPLLRRYLTASRAPAGVGARRCLHECLVLALQPYPAPTPPPPLVRVSAPCNTQAGHGWDGQRLLAFGDAFLAWLGGLARQHEGQQVRDGQPGGVGWAGRADGLVCGCRWEGWPGLRLVG
jgi:hypothetical protein